MVGREGGEERKQARGCWASTARPVRERRQRGSRLGHVVGLLVPIY